MRTVSFSLTWTLALLASVVTVLAKPATEICRTSCTHEGEIMVPGRFGFDTPPAQVRPYHRPNCGCVARGGCSGEAGLYSRQVVHKSDLVCGLKFETCCFDGPWPGVEDEFARAAECVPQEQCVRPYGILPTDVRDFGIIAPCPGYGAVRCIMVDAAGLLNFQAALASIAASSVQTHHAGQTESLVPAVVPARAPVVQNPIVAPVLPAPAPQGYPVTTSYVTTPANAPVVSNPVAAPVLPAPAPVVTYYVTSPVTAPVVANPIVTPVLPAPAPLWNPVTSFVTPVVNPVPIVPPSALPHPILGGLGLGYGYGLGFRKHFSFSKGFGYGFGK